jgi:hypothetical protein
MAFTQFAGPPTNEYEYNNLCQPGISMRLST